MRESAIERAVCEHAKGLGCIVIKMATPGHRGMPDRLFLHQGKAFFIEFKAPGKLPTALQLHWLLRIHEAGINCGWVDNIEKGKELVNQFTDV